MTRIATPKTAAPALSATFAPTTIAGGACSAARGLPVGISCSVSPVHLRHESGTARTVDQRDIPHPLSHPGHHRFMTSCDLTISVTRCALSPRAHHRPGGRDSSLRSSEQS